MWALLEMCPVPSASSSSGGLRGTIWRGRGGGSWCWEAGGVDSGIVPLSSSDDSGCLSLIICRYFPEWSSSLSAILRWDRDCVVRGFERGGSGVEGVEGG